ncbi:hypothetical protein [Candidatus Vallotiella sp. (ex Adelges kitamiensis)]|uniref:hypothetical protein n=1 Tax=Candidatus Vallotiella sp. (ex Adelges kitamiensis) TaxID=2864217 RepID=UPI001CE2752F|nr:hypothetical protein [Candidatus Vallotia sp. (ex Adelges kitamiensis)]
MSYAHTYGTRVERFLHGAKELSDLSMEIAPGLYEVELSYLHEKEWAYSADDTL